MNNRIVFLRITVLCLSMSTMIGYGYALGGLGGYLFGKGRPMVIAMGFIGGTLCALVELRLWRIYLNDLSKECSETEMDHKEGSDETED